MAHIEVDLAKCQGYTNCVITSPELFDLGSNGKAEVLLTEMSADLLALAEEAVDACPTGALRLVPG